jgi:hypothetical protein
MPRTMSPHSHLHTHEPHHSHSAEPPPPPPDDTAARRRWEFERRWTGRLEVYIAVILGLSAIVAAFAAYRNELRTHESTLKFNTAIRQLDDANQYYNSGNTVYEEDRTVFIEYAKAIHANDSGLANFLITRIASPQLKGGIRWWEQQKNPPPTPFVPNDTSYGVADYGAADKLSAKVKVNFEEAKKQQDASDRFTLVEVILATALFLFGIAGVTRRFAIKAGTALGGTAIFLTALIFFATA